MKRFSPLRLTLAIFLFTGALFALESSVESWQASAPQAQKEPDNNRRGIGISKSTPPKPAKDKTPVNIATPTTAETVGTSPAAIDGVGTQSFALIVGVSKYQNLPADAQLKFADADARAIKDFLVSEKGGFRPENVTLLVNESATYQQIIRELERLQNRCSTDSLAFIFFAGHGVVNSARQGYLLAYDSKPADLVVTSVEMNRFNSTLQSMRARSAVIFSDACHSGTIGDVVGQQSAADKMMNVSASAFAEPTGRTDQSAFIFSAASPTQSSLETQEIKHGLFTYHILDGLNGKADANTDGLIDAKELYDYVVMHVRADSEKLGSPQVPEFNPFYDRSIPLAYLNADGLGLYKKWFEADALVTRTMASFKEALQSGHLTRPERQSALFYYNVLNMNPRAPIEEVTAKKNELLAKLGGEAQAVIERAPVDPARWDEAAEWLERAFELSRDQGLRVKQSYCVAMARYRSGESVRAEKEFDVALTLIEDSQANEPNICWRIGQFYKNLGNWEKARRGYKLAVKSEPKLEWLTEYGEVLIAANALAEAEAELRRAYTINADYAPGLKLLAEVILRSEQREKISQALEFASRARKLNPTDVPTEEVYGWALFKSGQPAQAVEPLRKVALNYLNDDKHRDQSLLLLSQAYARSNDVDRGISALREAVQHGAKTPAVYETLAQLLERRGDLVGAIGAAETAASLTPGNDPKKAARIRRVAEYLERTGRLDEAAFKYREALRFVEDAKLSTTLENHAKVLLHRAGRPQEGGTLAKRSSASRPYATLPALLIIPGGREALENISGIKIAPGNETYALSLVFDTCLRDSTMLSRLKYFYEKYPELARKIESKGVKIGGRLQLPAAGQPVSEAAKEALKFFGIKDSAKGREVSTKEFESRRFILEALGGDGEKLARGAETFIRLKNDEFRVPVGIGRWVTLLGDVDKAVPDSYLLGFLKSENAMRFYAGIVALPDAAAEWMFDNAYYKDNAGEAPLCLYKAAPYLRFRSDGTLYFPGQQQGALTWQKMLKARSVNEAVQLLFKKENSEELYLFAALSSAREVGDFIARSPFFDAFYRSIKDESSALEREPFDLIDLLNLFRLEGERLRLPEPIELWLTEGKERIDPLQTLLAKLGKTSPGREIPVVRQIAALCTIYRERPDWLTDFETVNLIAAQVGAKKEALIEVALDLGMSQGQLKNYLARVTRLDAISTPAAKNAATLAFQATVELLRWRARGGVLDKAQVDELVNRLLELDTGGEKFVYELFAFVKDDLGKLPGASGEAAEKRLIELLAEHPALSIQAPDKAASPLAKTAAYRFDLSKFNREQMTQALEALNHTRFKDVADAFAALAALEQNPSDASAIEKLKAAVGSFVIPEPPPPPKKGAKQAVAPPLSIKDVVAQLSASVDSSTLTELRFQMLPFISESLLGIAYASTLTSAPGKDSPYAGMIRAHDLGTAAWGSGEFDAGRKAMRGNLARLGYALASLEPRLKVKDDDQAGKTTRPDWTSLMRHAFQSVDYRKSTDRALEFVTRVIDLGEDTLVLYVMGDQTAESVTGRLETTLSARRAQLVRSLLESAEVKKANSELSLSELYQIGLEYLKLRLAESPAAELAKEPGALGTAASVIVELGAGEDRRPIPQALNSEVNQFGIPIISSSGLMRLELRGTDTYEQAQMFKDPRRGLERLQDFKLAIARVCYRQGFSAQVALSPMMARAALEKLKNDIGATIPPDRDWQDAVALMQAFNEKSLQALIDSLVASNYAALQSNVSWSGEEKMKR